MNKNVSNPVFQQSYSPEFKVIQNDSLRSSLEAMYASAHGMNSSGYTGNAKADKRYANIKTSLRKVSRRLESLHLDAPQAQVVLDTMVAVENIAKHDTSNAGSPISAGRNTTAYSRNDNLQQRLSHAQSEISSRYNLQASESASSYSPSTVGSNIVALDAKPASFYQQVLAKAAAVALSAILAIPSIGATTKPAPKYGPVPGPSPEMTLNYPKTETNSPSLKPAKVVNGKKKSAVFSTHTNSPMSTATYEQLVQSLRTLTHPTNDNSKLESKITASSPQTNQASIVYNGPFYASVCSTTTVVKATTPINSSSARKYLHAEDPKGAGARALTARTKDNSSTNTSASKQGRTYQSAPDMSQGAGARALTARSDNHAYSKVIKTTIDQKFASSTNINAGLTNAKPARVYLHAEDPKGAGARALMYGNRKSTSTNSQASVASTVTNSGNSTNAKPAKVYHSATDMSQGAGARALMAKNPKAVSTNAVADSSSSTNAKPAKVYRSAVDMSQGAGARALMAKTTKVVSTNAAVASLDQKVNAADSTHAGSKTSLINPKTGYYDVDIALKDPMHPIIDSAYIAGLAARTNYVKLSRKEMNQSKDGKTTKNVPPSQKQVERGIGHQVDYVLTAIAMKKYHSGNIPIEDWAKALAVAKNAESTSTNWAGLTDKLNYWYSRGAVPISTAISQRVPDFTEQTNLLDQISQLCDFERLVHPNALDVAGTSPETHLVNAGRNIGNAVKSFGRGPDVIYSSRKGELFLAQNDIGSLFSRIGGEGMKRMRVNKKSGKAEYHTKWSGLPVLGPAAGYVTGVVGGALNTSFSIAGETASAGINISETVLQLPTYGVAAIAGKTNSATKVSRVILGGVPELGKWAVGTARLHAPSQGENSKAVQEVLQFVTTGNGKIRDYAPTFTTPVVPLAAVSSNKVSSALIFQKPASGVGACPPVRELYRLGAAGAESWAFSLLGDICDDNHNPPSNPPIGGGRDDRTGGDVIVPIITRP